MYEDRKLIKFNLKTYQIWLIFLTLVAIALGFAYCSGLVYNGNEGNLDLSRTLWLGYWIFITAALAIEGLLTARFFSRVSERSLTLLPFVIVFGLIGFCGLSPIGLMTFIGFALLFLLPIFTVILMIFSIIEFSRGRRLK